MYNLKNNLHFLEGNLFSIPSVRQKVAEGRETKSLLTPKKFSLTRHLVGKQKYVHISNPTVGRMFM